MSRWFQEYGIHVGMARYASGLRLHRLRASYLESVGRGVGIQGHILGLERSRIVTVLTEYSAETGCDKAFAHVTAGSGQHYR